MPTVAVQCAPGNSLCVSQLARAIWHYTNLSIEELALRSHFPASAKTLWRLIQGQEPWIRKYAVPIVGYVAECLCLPPDRLWRHLDEAQGTGDPTLQQFVCSRFWHPNPRSREWLDKCMQRQESVSQKWLYIGAVPLCLFPERALRRFVRHCHLAGQNVSKHIVAEWTAFGLNWRECTFNTPTHPDRILLTLHSTLHAIKNCLPPFNCLDLEDAHEMISSLAYDMVRERGMRIGLLDTVASVLEPPGQRLLVGGSFLAMTNDFLLERHGLEPLLCTIERDRGDEQGIALDREWTMSQRLLDAAGGPMDVETSFHFLRSFLD